MKKFRFKKWFQHIVEFVTAACALTILGISELKCDSFGDYLLVFGIVGIAVVGFISLRAFGNYEEE